MTRFGTATGQGKYSLSFETDNHEHYEYMQRAARFCVDGHFFGAELNFQRLQEELTRAKAELEQAQELNRRLEENCERFSRVNDSLIEDNEALKNKLERAEALWKATAQTLRDEIDRLTKERAEEQKQQAEAPWHDTIHSMQGEIIRRQCENERLRAKNEKLKKALDSAQSSMGLCKESYEAKFQELIERNSDLRLDNGKLRADLIDERDRFDKLTSYEQERNKMLTAAKAEAERAKPAYNVVMNLLKQHGFPVEALFIATATIVAAEEKKAQHDRR